MALSDCRSFTKGTLSAADIEAAVESTVRGTFAESTIRRLAMRVAKDRAGAPGDYDPETDVLLHDGDLVIEGDLSTGERPWIGMLIVMGDLVVQGTLEDCLDPESIIVVTGSLRAARLISEGFLEVSGDVRLSGSALFLDNDGCGEIFGDLVAELVYTKYHAVEVHGRVIASLACGDAQHIQCSHAYEFVRETDDKIRDLLVRDVLVIEGDESGDEWTVDYVDSTKMAERVRTGKPVLLESAVWNRETLRPPPTGEVDVSGLAATPEPLAASEPEPAIREPEPEPEPKKKKKDKKKKTKAKKR